MAIAHDPDIDYTFIHDLPLKQVTQFLIKKGVVEDAYNAEQLYVMCNLKHLSGPDTAKKSKSIS